MDGITPVSQAERLVIEAKRQVKWNEDVKRRTQVARWMDYYRNRQRDHVIERFKKVYTKTWAEIVKWLDCYPLTSVVIDQVAIMFDNGLSLSVPTAAENSRVPDMLADMIETSMLRPVLDTIESYQKLTGKVLARPVWRGGHVEVDILTGDRVFVEQDPLNPKQPVAVFYKVGDRVDSPIVVGKKHTYVRMTAEVIELVEMGGSPQTGMVGSRWTVIDSQPNPYGEIPVAEFATEIQLDSYWPEGSNPLVETNELLNMMRTYFAFGMPWQMFSQGVLRGYDSKEDLSPAPHRPIMIPPSIDGTQLGEFNFVNPNAPLAEVWDILSNQMPAEIAASFGLSADVIQAKSEKFASGYQLWLARLPIIERSVQEREYYRPAIKKLLRLMCQTYNFNSTTGEFPNDMDIRVDFGEPKMPMDPLTRIQVRVLKTQHGIWAPWMSIREDNPDLTEDEAKAQVAAIKADNAAYTTASFAGIGGGKANE